MLSNLPYDIRKTIAITSSPRSGSTWLGELLSTIPDSGILFEPFKQEEVPEAVQARVDWDTLVEADGEAPEIRAYLDRVFRGRALNKFTAQYIEHRRLRPVRTWIVKFVRANLMLSWIIKNFPIRRPILLIRHPCAVVLSQYHLRFREWITEKSIREHPVLKAHPEWAQRITGLDTVEKRLCAQWCLQNRFPLSASQPHGFEIVTYEQTVRRPSEMLQRIFSAWGLEVPRAALDRLKVRSRTTGSAVQSWKEKDPLATWTTRLAPDQIRQVLDMVHSFGMDFYTEALEPDYDKLANFPHPKRHESS
ncbi:MAG: sulfotransferase [Planctomycetes bacterium]|nr:sulfotransferase [Planctomycetota bacterium]